MSTVAGLDISLTATGICIIADGVPMLRTVGSTGTRNDTWQQQAHRIRTLRNRIMEHIPPDTMLAAVEGPAFHRNDAGSHNLAGIWWEVFLALQHIRIPTAVIPPSTLKKYACDKGNADKTAMAVAAARMWPGIPIADNNQTDALMLASAAAQKARLPLPFTILERHKLALAKTAWPDARHREE